MKAMTSPRFQAATWVCKSLRTASAAAGSARNGGATETRISNAAHAGICFMESLLALRHCSLERLLLPESDPLGFRPAGDHDGAGQQHRAGHEAQRLRVGEVLTQGRLDIVNAGSDQHPELVGKTRKETAQRVR